MNRSCLLRAGLAAILFLAVASPGGAQTQDTVRSLSLSEAVAFALEHHPLLDAARRQVEAAQAELAGAAKRPNPTLTITTENLPFTSVPANFGFGRSLDWYATVSQSIETAGKRGRRQTLASSNIQAAEAALEALRLRIVRNVKAGYEHALLTGAQVQLVRQNLSKFREIVQYNTIRVAEGYTPEGDLIKTQLEAQRLQYLVEKASLAFDQAKIALLRSLGDSILDVRLELTEPAAFDAALPDFGQVERVAMERPEIREAQYQLEAARAVLRLEQAQARPDVMVSFGYKRSGPANTLVGSVSVPLPFNNRNQGGIARAEADVRRAEAHLRQATNLVRAEVAAARLGVENARRQIEALRRDFLARAESANTVALAAYREGASDLLPVLESERARNGAQEIYLQALFEYRLSLRELEAAAGMDRLPISNPIGEENQ